MLSQLDALCERHPLSPKVVFVPNKQAGYSLAGALARAGRPWANLRMRVPSDLARELARPRFDARKMTRLMPDAEHLLVERLVERCIRQPETPLSLLKPSRRNTETFRSTLQSLRSARVDAAALRAAGKDELAALLGAFEEALEEGRWYDKPALLEDAIRVAKEQTPQGAVYAILDETPLTALEADFIAALTREDELVRLGREGYGARAPKQAAARVFSERSLGEEGAVHPAGRVRTTGLTPADAERVRVVRCLGVEAEVRGVLRDVVRRGIPFDEVEIAYTSPAPYQAQLVSLAEELELPVLFASGIPAHMTAPGQALLGYLGWISGGYDPKAVATLLRARRLSLGRLEDLPAHARPHHVASVLDRLPIPRGRSGFEGVFERVLQELNEALERETEAKRVQRIEREQGHVLAAHLLMRRLTQALPEEEPASLGGLADALEVFVDTFAPRATERQRSAQQSLAERLRRLQELDYEAPLSRLAGRLSEMLREHTVQASVAKPGAIYAAPLDRAGYIGRSHLYVVGLDDTAFPAGPSEDPLLLDDEREGLSVRLEQLRDRPAAQTWQLVRLLGQATGHVTLTAAVTSLADGKERFGSAFFTQVAHQLKPEAVELDAWIDTWGLVGDGKAALTDREWYCAAASTGRLAQTPADAFRALEAGGRALARRSELVFSEYDGYAGTGTPHLVPGADAEVIFSSSRLETLAACPHKYFLRYVLGVAPPEEQEEDPSRWLDARHFGSLLHEVLAAFMDEITRQGERPRLEHAARLEEVVSEWCERWREERLRPPSEMAYETGVARLGRAAQLFLREEAARDDAEPVGFEVSFGRGEDGRLSHAEPVEVCLGEHTLRLRGQIDRIDRHDGGYWIWDYKSGSDSPFDEGDLLAGGQKLQWALYAYALEEMVRRSGELEAAPVARSGYFFVSEKTQGKRIAGSPPPREVVAEALRPLFAMIERGAFLKVHKGKSPCTFCDYRLVCSDEAPGSRKAAQCIAGSRDEEMPFARAVAEWLK